jgi:hypothetical protein
MEKYYGMYLGLVVNDQDPEVRDRVQIYVPGVTNTIYDNWNNKDTNKSIGTDIGSTFTLNEEILKKLRRVLPWAEKASPLIGRGTAMYHQESIGATSSPLIPRTSTPSYKIDGTNGKLDINDPTVLVPIEGSSDQSANPIVAAKVKELIAAANKEGITLGVTEGYRSYDEQVRLRNELGAYVRGSGKGGAATPGRSNHGLGLAIDFTGVGKTSDEEAYAWLARRSPDFGWSNVDGGVGRVSGEDHHYQINPENLDKHKNILNDNQYAIQTTSSQSTTVPQNSNPFSNPLAELPPPVVESVAVNATEDVSEQTTQTENGSTQKHIKLEEGKKSEYPENVDTVIGDGIPNGSRSVTGILSRVWLFFYGGDIQKPVFFAYSLPPNETRAHNGISTSNNNQNSSNNVNIQNEGDTNISESLPKDDPKNDSLIILNKYLNGSIDPNKFTTESVNYPFIYKYGEDIVTIDRDSAGNYTANNIKI